MLKPRGPFKMSDEKNLQLLRVFADAWNAHNLDAIMACMTEDCVFESSAGPDVCGTRSVGQQDVRTAFSKVFAEFPDAQWPWGPTFRNPRPRYFGMDIHGHASRR